MAERLLSGIVKVCREGARLSQAQLGAACNPPRTQEAVAQWESGARGLSEATLEVVAEALGTSVEEMLLDGIVELRRRRQESGS